MKAFPATKRAFPPNSAASKFNADAFAFNAQPFPLIGNCGKFHPQPFKFAGKPFYPNVEAFEFGANASIVAKLTRNAPSEASTFNGNAIFPN
jgi:hypothetical protein